jgi:predicted GNAT family acetyltransferase
VTDARDLRLSDNVSEQRFEAHLTEQLAGFSEYRLSPGRIVFFHTLVEPAFEGAGIGSRLVRYELDDARARGLTVTPRCPFVRAFIKRHPEYADLVDGGAAALQEPPA